MAPRKERLFEVDIRVQIKALNEVDLMRKANDSLAEGLVDPGFVEDGYVLLENVNEIVSE